MQAEIRWTNMKTSKLVQSFAEKALATSRFIVKQLVKMKGLALRKMSKVMTLKEAANRAGAVSVYWRAASRVSEQRLPDIEHRYQEKRVYRTVLSKWKVVLSGSGESL